MAMGSTQVYYTISTSGRLDCRPVSIEITTAFERLACISRTWRVSGRLSWTWRRSLRAILLASEKASAATTLEASPPERLQQLFAL